jgi:Zn-dependent M28 family amino/carboxypeptidase
MELKLEVAFSEADSMGYNIIAEIPGTDLKDQYVILGGHFDSWHAGTGATDDAAGVAVCMEAVRLIQSLGVKPRRTIRIALWGGEEQGLLGSRGYVSDHLAKRDTTAKGELKLEYKPEFDKTSAYFNLDNGTGKIRGIYLQGNEGVRSIFRSWLSPFRAMDASTLSSTNTGGTDHGSFDQVNIPAFQFIQDPIDYDTRTHHSNMDVYDRLQPEDLKQASVIMATFVWHAATRADLLPRKPKQPARGGF